MKKIIYTIFLFAITLVVAQKKTNNRILLGAYIPKQAENIPRIAKRMFVNKLGQIITKNGISANIKNSRFIITPNVSVLSKDITATAPPMHAINLEVTLYIGDGIAGNLFSSETFTLKGVGTNENKAMINALKRLNPKNENIKEFIAKGKEKIIDYYNENCDLLIKKANNLEGQSKFLEALYVLSVIPEATTCYDSVQNKVKDLFVKYINRDCEQKLNTAHAIWIANQDINAANKVGALLSTVDPNSACFSEIQNLYNQVESRVKEISDRPWKYKLKVLDAYILSIQAAKEVGIAYGNNQPNTVYNIRGWF